MSKITEGIDAVLADEGLWLSGKNILLKVKELVQQLEAELAKQKSISHVIQCPDEDCCGCLYEEIVGDVICNECGKHFIVVVEMSEKLKPCPFCGGKARMGSLGGDKQNWAIWCTKCGLPCAEMGVEAETKEEIIKAWNRRAK